MVTTFYPPYGFGGDAIFVRNLSRELVRRGHHVEVVHNLDAYLAVGGERHAVADREHDERIVVHSLASRYAPLTTLSMHQRGRMSVFGAQLKELLEGPFDVVHFHNVSLMGAPEVLQLGRGMKLYSLHEWWLVCPTHTLFRYDRDVCEQPQCVRCSLVYRRPPQLWRWTDRLREAIGSIDAFISPSRFGISAHAARGLALPVRQIPNFIPLSPGGESSGTTTAREPYFLFVGRLEKLKGLQTILPLFRGYERAALWVAGTGSYERTLRRLARGSNVRFLGWQSGEDLRRLYRQAIGVIVPSLCFEMFCLVVAEALQQRTPVLVRNRGALPELIETSGGGLLFEDADQLLEGMERLLDDPELRSDLGGRGYAGFLRQWTPEVYIEQYLSLIREQSVVKRVRL